MSTHRNTVLLTRPEGSSPVFENILREHGLDVLHVPMIAIQSLDDWSEVDATLADIAQYDGVLFTSANAVRFTIERLKSIFPTLDVLPPMHCVGERTEEAVKEFALAAGVVPASASAEELAAALGEVAGKRFLHPCSNIARQELRDAIAKRGGSVESLVVYLTNDVSDDQLEAMRSRVESESIGCIAFFSPSAVARFIRTFPNFHEGEILIAAIGRTTADALLEFGVRVDVVPQEQTAEALATLIARYLTFNQSGALLTHGI